MNIYERFNLYALPEKFYLEPCDRDGGTLANFHLQIDRHSTFMTILDSTEHRIPVVDADISRIYGVIGTLRLVSGNVLILIRGAQVVGQLSGHDIWRVESTQLIPYKKSALHLTEKQLWFERHFIDMIELVLSTGGFYYSYTLDITRSLQWLFENAGPHFDRVSPVDRADDRFMWNGHLLKELRAVNGAGRFCLPIMHGFIGSLQHKLANHLFKVFLISRRSIQRAGVRFHKRGVNSEGQSANFVETEQIVEVLKGTVGRPSQLTSFLQTRGSIPLVWSQRPNLRWQPCPTLRPTADQLQAYVRHFSAQHQLYNGTHVIVDLVNQKGRERRVGGELERVSLQANLPFVKYHPFDFHRECHAMNWGRLALLRDQLRPFISQFGFFVSSESREMGRFQVGYFRTNCMDCLDRTNVVQSLLGRESLSDQLALLNLLLPHQKVEDVPELEAAFKNLWADNGDMCSRQYAGTPALKADFTRLGKRTYQGAMNDALNALTRYFRNNFSDGFRQDAIDLFLGNFTVDPNDLPLTFEATLLTMDYHGVAIVIAAFSMAMTVLCLFVADSLGLSLFWVAVFFFCISFIFLNGEEFVNSPKLKTE